MVCQHCQRSERAASLFLHTSSWLNGGSWLDYSTILVGGLLAACLYPGVPVLRFWSTIRLDRVYTSPHSYKEGIRMGFVFNVSVCI